MITKFKISMTKILLLINNEWIRMYSLLFLSIPPALIIVAFKGDGCSREVFQVYMIFLFLFTHLIIGSIFNRKLARTRTSLKKEISLMSYSEAFFWVLTQVLVYSILNLILFRICCSLFR